MEVEKRLFAIYEKVKEKTHTKRDQLMLVFLNTFYHKRTEAYFNAYMAHGLKNRRRISKSLPKLKSGDPVYLLVKDHDTRVYCIHLHKNKKIGYTYVNENKK